MVRVHELDQHVVYLVSGQLGPFCCRRRNEKCKAQAPLQRDPAVFTATEQADGHACREMSYKIQKWNVKSAEVFPILLANTRVDWLGIEDKVITQHFPILLEGILRDVFSQRSSVAWQGAPPQKVTVSILLPGRCTSDLWLDYLQSQRHFWPSMTTRFASMAPLSEMVFRKERQRLKSKHLWDTMDLDWGALSKKLYVHKPTGLSREVLWQQLFWNKHRLNPWVEL